MQKTKTGKVFNEKIDINKKGNIDGMKSYEGTSLQNRKKR